MATVFLALVCFVLGAWLGFILSCLCIMSGRTDAEMELEEREEEDTNGSSL